MITNIQRMCMNDGPGIRTTVFFKGCNLRCPWCANPENIHFEPELYHKAEGETGVYGTEYTEEMLWNILRKDKKYWKKEGGVTFSGGEPLLHLQSYLGLLQRLKDSGIHMAVETALQVPKDCVQELLPYIDLFIVDVKLLDAQECRQVLGGDCGRYMENVALLSETRQSVWFRMPCNQEYTMTVENCKKVLELVRDYPPSYMEIFQTHSLGRRKYESLGLKCQEYTEVEEQAMLEWQQQLRMYVPRVEWIRI